LHRAVQSTDHVIRACAMAIQHCVYDHNEVWGRLSHFTHFFLNPHVDTVLNLGVCIICLGNFARK